MRKASKYSNVVAFIKHATAVEMKTEAGRANQVLMVGLLMVVAGDLLTNALARLGDGVMAAFGHPVVLARDDPFWMFVIAASLGIGCVAMLGVVDWARRDGSRRD